MSLNGPTDTQEKEDSKADGPAGLARGGSIISGVHHSLRGSGTYSSDQTIGAAPPPVTCWRPTRKEDVPHILALATEETSEVFGELELPNAIERSVLSLTQLNCFGEVVAFLCLSNWPSLPAIDSTSSPEWLGQLYEKQFGCSSSSLLLRYFVWNPVHGFSCARLLLHSVFATLPHLRRILLVLPPKAPKNELFEKLFIEHLAPGFKTPQNLQILLETRRSFFIRSLRIRKAQGDDNDDLAPIFDQQNYRLRELYSDFYITELIANPESREIIVAEKESLEVPVQSMHSNIKGRAIGVMVLNNDVNLPLLNALFYLTPFYGLRQPHQRDILNIRTANLKIDLAGLDQSADMTDEGAVDDTSAADEDTEEEESSNAAIQPRETKWARLAREKQLELERRRRRLDDPEHYLSAISLIPNPGPPPQLVDEDLDDEAGQDVVPLPEQADFEEEEQEPTSEESHSGPMRRLKVHHAEDFFLKESLPEFKGLPNAFLIELFALSDTCDDRLVLDFLEASFGIFPNLDYCALAVPHAYPTFPLLDFFVRVTPRERKNFHQELYVAHRWAILGDLEVRVATVADMPAVAQLLGTVQSGVEVLLEEMRAALSPKTDPELQAFVCFQGQTIVGIAVVSSEEDIEYIHTHYAVERHTDLAALDPEDHGSLRLCILSPVFAQQSSLFLRELHRLSGKTCLYYMLYPGSWSELSLALNPDEESLSELADGCPAWLTGPASLEGLRERDPSIPQLSVVTVLDELIPVAPRAPPDGMHHDCDKTVDQESTEEPRLEHPYALFMSTSRFTSLPKATVNVRVVVIGASDAGLAFLETLVFSSPEVRYNNLTLVSKYGLPGETQTASLASKFFPYKGRYHPRFLANLQLGAWVNVVRSMVIRINREKKVVELERGYVLPYDLLFLFCGQQFCRPLLCPDCESAGAYCKHYKLGRPQPAAISSLRAVIDRGAGVQRHTPTGAAPEMPGDQATVTVQTIAGEDDVELVATCAPPPNIRCPDEDDPPINLFLLNSAADVERALYLIHPFVRNKAEYQVLVYGHCAEALSCIGGLLAWGVAPSCIVFVDPLPDPEFREIGQAPAPALCGDTRVDKAVLDSMRSVGISVNQGLELVGWTVDDPDWSQWIYLGGRDFGRIHQANVRALPGASGTILEARMKAEQERQHSEAEEEEIDPNAPIRISCVGIFYFARKIVDPVTFKALLESDLVVDGQLVIDRLGRTNDPFILAGGPLTMYQRKLGIPDLDHEHYSSWEIGFKMAEQMRSAWDPVIAAQAHLSKEMEAASASKGLPSPAATALDKRKPTLLGQQIAAAVRASLRSDVRLLDLVPTLTAPLVRAFMLPNSYFLHVRSPGPDSQSREEAQGQQVQTGDPSTGEYCRVQFDEAGFVREILCLSQEPLPVEAIKAAFGHHEESLQGLKGSDPLDFFRNLETNQDPSASVYHRQPHWDWDWQHDLDMLFGYPSSLMVPAATEIVRNNAGNPLSPAQETQLQLQWLESTERTALVRRVQHMLKFNKKLADAAIKACLST